MRDLFKGYYLPTPSEADTLWRQATFVFDTNILIDFYKYHEKTTDIYLAWFDENKERVWMPYQVAYEFHENRAQQRYESTKFHGDRIKELESIKGKLKNTAHKSRLTSSDLEIELLEKLENLILTLTEEKDEIKKETRANRPDSILDRISVVFEGRVGAEPNSEELAELIEQGRKRFIEKIPPGYEDEKTKPDGDQFGDYFLWHQTMVYAKENQCDVIFITEDSKLDWWKKVGSNSEVVGPRPELIQEFRKETGRDIIIYSGRDFFSLLAKETGKRGNSKAISEARDDVESVAKSRQRKDEMDSRLETSLSVAIKDSRMNRNVRRWLSDRPASVVALRGMSVDERIAAIEAELNGLYYDQYIEAPAGLDEESNKQREIQAEYKIQSLISELNRLRLTRGRINEFKRRSDVNSEEWATGEIEND